MTYTLSFDDVISGPVWIIVSTAFLGTPSLQQGAVTRRRLFGISGDQGGAARSGGGTEI
jgi:hypothetical protein